MTFLGLVLASVVCASTLLVAAGESLADGTDDCFTCPPVAAGGDGVITVGAGKSDSVPGRGSPTQGKGGGRRDYFFVEEYLTPACLSNGLNGSEALCLGAVQSCQAVGQIRFWVWHRRIDVQVGPPETRTTGLWDQEPGSFCLGADDPGVPNIVTTLARSRSLFEQRVRQLVPPAVRTSPGPKTLVNYETEFSADNARPFTFDVTVAGVTVRLDVAPTRFTWRFGDGSTETTTVAEVPHTYRQHRAMQVQVDVEWGGTFRIVGQPDVYDINPPATVAGTPSVLTVVQARAENVSR